MALVNVNKLKAYWNPMKLIVKAIAFIRIIKNLEKNLHTQYKEELIFGEGWRQLANIYGSLIPIEKLEGHHIYPKYAHPKNYGKLFTTI